MYSCHKPRSVTVQLKNIRWLGFASAKACRFDKRYEEIHQNAGCAGCDRPWDVTYLRNAGLIKLGVSDDGNIKNNDADGGVPDITKGKAG
jgi:hypothetical protein